MADLKELAVSSPSSEKGATGLSPLLLIFVICLVVTFLTEMTSNTATANLLMPILSAAAIATDLAIQIQQAFPGRQAAAIENGVTGRDAVQVQVLQQLFSLLFTLLRRYALCTLVKSRGVHAAPELLLLCLPA